MQKEKIQLKEEQETLLIPLYSKAQPLPAAILNDSKPREILDVVEYDFSRLHIPHKTVVMMCLRARKLDDYLRAFLAEHPAGVVLHLGCGLDNRVGRVAHPQADWYDLDYPTVIDLRRKFYPESAQYHLLPSSVTELGWVEQVRADGRPVMVVAEGLLMYLTEGEVKSLLLKLQAAFPGCRFAADVFSALTARSAKGHPSLGKTGAVTPWGIDDAKTIETWSKGIRLVEEWYFNQSPDISRFGFGYRLAFGLAGLFPIALKAHRVIDLTLKEAAYDHAF
jgi:O-methyltransferase involved in polyketide biosynthesis